jgi:hypothetical protein
MTTLELPQFKSTEDAIRFGANITLDQFIFLKGARAALIARYNDEPDLQQKLFIAVQFQLIREALESAPDIVLAHFAARHGVQGDPATPRESKPVNGSGHETAAAEVNSGQTPEARSQRDTDFPSEERPW